MPTTQRPQSLPSRPPESGFNYDGCFLLYGSTPHVNDQWEADRAAQLPWSTYVRAIPDESWLDLANKTAMSEFQIESAPPAGTYMWGYVEWASVSAWGVRVSREEATPETRHWLCWRSCRASCLWQIQLRMMTEVL